MRAKDINTTNLDIIVEVARECNNSSTLPANISQILEKVVIYYRLDQVLPFELMGLKNLGRIIDIREVATTSSEVPTSDLLEILGISALDTIIVKADGMNGYLDKKYNPGAPYVRKLGPISSQMYVVEIILSGADILNLYGYSLDKMFKAEDGTEDLDPENIQGRLMTGLVNATYRVLTNTLTKKDVLTDAWFDRTLYSVNNDSEYYISSLYDNFGYDIPFINSPKEKFMKDIHNAASIRDDYREWTLEIVCNTSLAMYFYYMETSIKCKSIQIIHTSDLMVVLSDQNKRLELHNYDYDDGVSANSIAESYCNLFDHKMKFGELDLIKRFALAPANATIRYTIHVKFDMDLISYLCDLKDDDTFVISKPLVSLIDQVDKMIKVYKL